MIRRIIIENFGGRSKVAWSKFVFEPDFNAVHYFELFLNFRMSNCLFFLLNFISRPLLYIATNLSEFGCLNIGLDKSWRNLAGVSFIMFSICWLVPEGLSSNQEAYFDF